VGLFMFFAILIIYFSLKKNHQHKKLADNFLTLGKQKGVVISEYEMWRDTLIGIDTEQKAVLYQRENEKEHIVEFALLKDVSRCELVSISTEAGSSKGTQMLILKLELKLIFKAKDKPDLVLNFYNSESGFQLGDDLQLINHWKSKISNLI